MSVVDPVVLGDVRFTPLHFNDTSVHLEVHVMARNGEGDGEWVQAHDAEGSAAIVALPIKAWESYQGQAVKVALYEQMFAAQQQAVAT